MENFIIQKIQNKKLSVLLGVLFRNCSSMMSFFRKVKSKELCNNKKIHPKKKFRKIVLEKNFGSSF